MQKLFSQKAFTLIELMMVMAIIGILSAIVLATVDPLSVMKRGRDSQRKNDISEIARAVGNYATAHGGQPPLGTNGPYLIGTDQYTTDFSYNPTFLDPLKTSSFLKTIPRDPLGELNNSARSYYGYMSNMRISDAGANYVYDGSSFVVYAYLENRGDTDCLRESDGNTVYTPTNFTNSCLYLFQNGALVRKWN